MTAQIYHNPRCSKSRQTRQLLEDQQVEFEEIRYLDTPPDKATLTEIINMLGIAPLDLFRTGEALFKELDLSKKDERSNEEWIQILVDNPRLIERPIVINNGKAAIGRPPEKVLDIL